MSAYTQDRGTGVFMIDRDVLHGTAADIAGVHLALLVATRRISTRQSPLTYLRTVYLPADQRCLSFFEAVDPRTIRLITDTAQLPEARICEAFEYSDRRLHSDLSR